MTPQNLFFREKEHLDWVSFGWVPIHTKMFKHDIEYLLKKLILTLCEYYSFHPNQLNINSICMTTSNERLKEKYNFPWTQSEWKKHTKQRSGLSEKEK